jgi:hypothetical protein
MMLNLVLKKRSMVLSIISIFLLSTLHVFNVSGKIIDTSNHDSVLIDIPEYISGSEDINVYSNTTVSEYNLYINGTNISNDTNPILYTSGVLNNSDAFIYTSGSNGYLSSGYPRDMDENDSNYVDYNPERIFFFDDYDLRVQVGFSTLQVIDFDYVYNATVYLRFNVTDNAGDTTGDMDNLDINMYNASAGGYYTLEDIDTKGSFNYKWFYEGSNLSQLTEDGILARSNSISYRITAEDTGIFDARIFYFVIEYNTNKTIDNVDCYELVDTYLLDSTTYPDGIYNLTAEIIDFDGNAHYDQVWITIDNTEASIDDITITPTFPNNTREIEIYTTVSDTNLGRVYGEYEKVFGDNVTINNTNNQIFNFTDYFTNGTYNFYVYAIDLAGNIAYKNKSFTVDYVQDILYIDNPEIVIGYESREYIGDLAWVNITLDNVSEVNIYVNDTLNDTYSGNPASIDYNITSSIPIHYNVTVETFYTNSSFHQNNSFVIEFLEPERITIPSIIIGYESKEYVNQNATITLDISNSGNASLYRNGSFLGNYTDGYHIYNENSTIEVEYEYIVELFYKNGTHYVNETFNIVFENITVVQEPAWTIVLHNESYLPENLSIDIWTLNTSSVEIYVNGTLKETISGNSSDVIYFNATESTEFFIDVAIIFTNGTNQTYNFTGIINDIPIITLPSYNIFYKLKNNTIEFEISSNFTGSLDFYVDSIFNRTISGNVTDTFSIDLLSGIHNFSLEVYYPNSTFFDVYNFSANVTVIYLMNFTYKFPSYSISYPYNAVESEKYNLTVSTQESYGFDLSIYINGSFINQTYYSGNVTHHIPINTYFVGNHTFEFKFYFPNSTLWNIEIISVDVVRFVDTFETIVIEYSGKAYKEEVYYINGTLSFSGNVTITKDNMTILDSINVQSFSHSYIVGVSDTFLRYNITVYKKGFLIYWRYVEIPVVVERDFVFSGESDPDLRPLFDFIEMNFFIFLALVVIMIFVVSFVVVYYNDKKVNDRKLDSGKLMWKSHAKTGSRSKNSRGIASIKRDRRTTRPR